jgi:hypothetical protein
MCSGYMTETSSPDARTSQVAFTCGFNLREWESRGRESLAEVRRRRLCIRTE